MIYAFCRPAKAWVDVICLSPAFFPPHHPEYKCGTMPCGPPVRGAISGASGVPFGPFKLIITRIRSVHLSGV